MTEVWKAAERRSRGVVLSVAALGVVLGITTAQAAGPKVTARAALVMDAKTGEVLWSKNPDQKRAPASTTKIVTTVLALESGRLDESFKVSKRAQKQVPSKLHLRSGQKVTLRDLTYSLMLKSANDGAVVVAEGLGGSVEKFAKLMEARARKAGAKKTTFRNPSGLSHSQHLTTARDLGKILRAALDVPGFRRVAGTQTRKIRVRGSKVKTVSLHNKNRLLKGYFASVIGKTGYTRAAGRCFAGAATYEGREAIIVVLGAKDLWGDSKKLVQWAHKGDGKAEWPRVQVASAKSKSAPKPAAKPKVVSKDAPKPEPKFVAKAAPKPAPKLAPKVVAKAAPKTVAKPTVTASVSKPASAYGARSNRPRSAALEPPPRPRSAALAASTRPRSAALTGSQPRARSAALTARPPSPQRVAALHRSTEPPAYVRSFRPEGNVRRGCTGSGCARGVRSFPPR